MYPEISKGDLPFSHPFGFDTEFYIVPEGPAGCDTLMAPNNGAPTRA